MTLGLYALAAAIILAVALLVVRRVRDSRRRQAVWICTDCRVGFSSEAAARDHLATHQQH